MPHSSRRRAALALLLPWLLWLAPACSDESVTPPDSTTDGGAAPARCQAGATVCAGSTLYTCASDSASWKGAACPAATPHCRSVSGVARCTAQACEPGVPACADDGVTTRTCKSDGSGWTRGKTCDASKGQLCYSGQCADACTQEAKNKQNVGCTFYPVNLENDVVDQMGVVVSNPNKVTATVTLRGGDGKVMETRKVSAGKLSTFIVKAGSGMLKGTGKARWAFKLTSDLPVAAYQFSPLNRSVQRSNDASLLLARAALGRAHVAFSVPVSATDTRTFVTVVGTAAGTKVTVTPSDDVQAGGGVPAIAAGKAYTTTLGEQEILQVSSSKLKADLTGTQVRSDKPVAVFAGNTCAEIPAGKFYCDQVQEQMFPVETWGWTYMAVKARPRGWPGKEEDDWWRIIAAQDDTTVTLSGSGNLPTVPKMSAGFYVQITTKDSFIIKADKPIAVAHYLVSQEAVQRPTDEAEFREGFQTPKACTQSESHTNLGDPALSMVVPVSQFRDRYIFLTPDSYRYDFISVIVPETASAPLVLLDDKPIPTLPAPIGGTNYRRAYVRVTDGPHTLTAQSPFGVEVYGYDCNVSYSYSGGVNLKAINPIN